MTEPDESWYTTFLIQAWRYLLITQRTHLVIAEMKEENQAPFIEACKWWMDLGKANPTIIFNSDYSILYLNRK